MPNINLNFLIEALAKALCFERYVAERSITDPDKVNLAEVLQYFEEHEATYIQKSEALLMMVEHSEEFMTNTLH